MAKKPERKPSAQRASGGSRFLKTLRSEQARFVLGLLFLLLSAFMGLAFVSFLVTGAADQALLENVPWSHLTDIKNDVQNWMGTYGAVVAEACVNRWIGVSALLFVGFLLRLSLRLIHGGPVRPLFLSFVLTALWAIWLSVALGFFFVRFYEDSFLYLGGHHGYDLTRLLCANLGSIGTFFVIVIVFVLLSLLVWKSTIRRTRAVIDAPKRWAERFMQRRAERAEAARLAAARAAAEQEAQAAQAAQAAPLAAPGSNDTEAEEEREDPTPTTPDDDPDSDPADNEDGLEDDDEPHDDDAGEAFTVQAAEATDTVDTPAEPMEDYDPTAELSDYEFPSFDLLRAYGGAEVPIDMAEQNANQEKIRVTLQNYGIEIQSITAIVGPTITLFEIILENGTRISRVRSLSDEIAMSIASTGGIRIIAPIPGKSAIGIEVPNRDPQTVSMRDCIASRTFQESKFDLPIALGKTITNEVFTFDLAKTPHLLVAGATGQGKSVGLNAIITSLLYKKHPSQLKLVLVDPKMVEFSIYQSIERHYLAKLPDEEEPIITDTTKVVATLNSLVLEMEDRYALVKDAGLRNIKEYNQKFIKRQLNPTKHIQVPSGSKAGTYHHYLPYIVVIVDEYGDLMMTAGKEIELPIARIAQKARAVGIHMILATQRPSAKVVTGIIKANFPARIAFKVGSSLDSGIILDQPGAQKLIGRGDLLISASNRFERVQCAFVDTPEVTAINDFIAAQQAYPHAFLLPEPPVNNGNGGEGGDVSEVNLKQLDPMFAEAAEFIVASGLGSTGSIQRKFGVGYARAGRIMDQLEAAGIVGPYAGSKARDVLITSPMELQNLLQSLNDR